MTVIDELLVILDDGTPRTLEECVIVLPDRTRQTLSSTLGRLTAKGWVATEKDRLQRVNLYRSTPEGQAIVTKTLQHLKLSDDKDWDERWLFVIFNIPERQRKYRDILRNRLMAVGFGRVQNSVWVTGRDIRFEFEDLLQLDHIAQSVTIVRPTLSQEDSEELVKAFDWDWNSLDLEYKEFITQAKTFLQEREKLPIQAKLLVYYYTKLLSQDPKLPSRYEPKSYRRHEAHDLYLKVRPYCYDES